MAKIQAPCGVFLDGNSFGVDKKEQMITLIGGGGGGGIKFGDFTVATVQQSSSKTFTDASKILNVFIYDEINGDEIGCDVDVDNTKVTVTLADKPKAPLRVIVMYI